MTPDEIARWPGKSFEAGFHPALWHMLDVGAVATCLLARRPLLGNTEVDRALAFLITLHDLGKVSDTFRRMITGQQYIGGPPHWQHSYRLLLEHDGKLAEYLGGGPNVRKILYAAVAGHHGGPPENLAPRAWNDQKGQIGAEALADAGRVIDALAPLFPDASLASLGEIQARKLSWALSGLTVEADWIGSNNEWFGLKPPDIPIRDYWEMALIQAQTAISEAGLFAAQPAAGGVANVLGPYDPRPMQQAVTEIALPEGPTLALIEDATGSGKTEAALILAARMMAAGKGEGLYFALPTMATSNAMLARLEAVAPALFEGRPTLALTHGKARMNELFRKIRGRTHDPRLDGPTCSDWLADDRRRVLLADIGVGTIDQALLSVLPTRFNTLRLHALSGRILIVDEAHSYDPYMERELQRLLEFHAMLGGSAIVMTATLPRAMRDGFAKAFQRGRGKRRPQPVSGTAYPQLTMIGEKVDNCQPAPVPATCREIGIQRLGDEAEAIALLKKGAGLGAACVWVRNAVDDAIAAVSALRAEGIEADLLHARFIVADRLAHEQALQARFGRAGQGRAGRVLVATQVVEASLDLDFDLMVSDLAPVGALIQRAGRLWRHMDLRPAQKRPVEGPALHILSPDPDHATDKRWLHSVLQRGAWVYPQDAQWRTARALFDAGVIRAPDGLRNLIEAVHGDDPLPLPASLEDVGIETEGRALSEAAQARNNLIDPGDSYDQPAMQRVYDDEIFPTRLGKPQITLRLARCDGDCLVPFAEAGEFGWQMSEVQLSAARYERLPGVDQTAPEIEALKAKWPEWKRRQVILAPVGEGGEICEGLSYDPEFGLLIS